ncbi:MAG: hypothetical protein M5R42_16105 [Rhodocyclaceae bacterium]|nr:hypothetical protein [Rhodocyclaceae bacterium]
MTSAIRPAATGPDRRHGLQRHAQADRAAGLPDQHQLSIEKARDAYRKQFDIGQRTLPRPARQRERTVPGQARLRQSAEHDLAIAYVRAQAGLGKLLPTLGVSKAGDPPRPSRSYGYRRGSPENCPPDNPQLDVANKDALSQRPRVGTPSGNSRYLRP